MAQTQRRGRGTGKEPQREPQKEPEQERTGKRQNLRYHTEEDHLFILQREELERECGSEEEVELDRLRSRSTLPDGDEDDDERWKHEEEVPESDDWDRRLHSLPTTNSFEEGEPTGFHDSVGNEWVPLPDILVDCEETLGGPELQVRLGDRALSLWAVRRTHGKAWRDRLAILQRRQDKLLDIAQYIVAYQKDFFLQQGPLRPLTQAQVAVALWPAESLDNKRSNVSRLLDNKWLRTPWGDVIPVERLFPSLLEYIKAVLREHDQVVVEDGQVAVRTVIPVDPKRGPSIVAELRKRLGAVEGLSPENVKHIMQEAGIPRVARDRIAAYKTGMAWWREHS